MTVTPVARDELVYVSSDKERLRRPVSVGSLARADLVMAETSWRDVDSARGLLREALQRAGHTLLTKIEVEDVETAVEIVGLGLADSVLPRGAVEQLAPRLAPGVGWVSLRPRMYETMAVVHRQDAELSPAARLVIELATARIQDICEPIVPRVAG
jgi:hypothetical protein